MTIAIGASGPCGGAVVLDDEVVRFDVKPMREELERLIAGYGLRDVTLLLVPSVHEWLLAHAIESNEPFRQASFIPLLEGTKLILVRAELTSDDPGASTLFFHIGREDYDWISGNLARYARHLVLHEMAHALGTLDEAEADRWTVPELRKIEARGSHDPLAGPNPLK